MKTEVLPLQVMEERLVTGPPLLGVIWDMLDPDEAIEEFIELVRTYLPEHEREILNGDRGHKLSTFVRLFSEKYFPLSINEDWFFNLEQGEYGLGDFCYILPVELMGFSDMLYEELAGCDNGQAMMTALIECPYERGRRGNERTPFLEEAAKVAGKELVSKIPEHGWTPAQLHALVDNTRYAGLADWADWLRGETGSCQLNASYDWYEMESWSEGLVQQLTEEYPELLRVQESVNNMVAWLNRMPAEHFSELLEFLLARQKKIKLPPGPDEVKPGKKTLMEIFDDDEDGDE
uniref:Uncharacterized protein n=2 Tax=viral metagenome TaxID=1070528 RepID=A0A6M3KP71_9ZZZZ